MRAMFQDLARQAMVATGAVVALSLVMAGCQPAGGEPAIEPSPVVEEARPVVKEAAPPDKATAPAASEDKQPGETATPSAPLPEGVAARVNGEPITRDELIEVLLKRYGQRALDSIIQHRVIRQEAARLNVTASERDVADALDEFYIRGRFPEEMPLGERKKQWAQRLTARGLTMEDFTRDMEAELLLKEVVARRANVTDEMVRAEFDRRHGEKLLLREIVVADEKKAGEIHAELEAGGDFNALASKHSANRREARDGGKIALPVARGTRTKAFEEAAWSLQEGQFSKPFQVGRTWTLLKLDGKTAPETVKFDDVKERYREELLRREEARMRPQALGELMDAATIERRTPLVESEKP